jgi:hypothetical protein
MEASASFSPAAARASLFAKLPNNIIIDIVNLEMKRRMNEHRKIHRGKMKEVAMDIRLLGEGKISWGYDFGGQHREQGGVPAGRRLCWIGGSRVSKKRQRGNWR